MAHNSYVRAGAVWNNGSAVTSAEFNLFDVAQYKAANFDDGGTWSPAAAIVIGGLGINVTGDSVLTKITGSTVTGALTVAAAGTISLAAGSFLTGTTQATSLTITTGSDININSGSTVDCASPVVLTGTFTSNGAAVFASTLTLNTTADIALGSVSVTRTQQGTPMAVPGDWALNTSERWQSLIVGTDTVLPLELPTGCTLTAVEVYVTGSASYGASMPAVKPAIELTETDHTGSLISRGTAVDSSADTTAFKLNHVIQITGLSLSVTRTTGRFYIVLTAESGANSLIALRVTGWRAVYTVTKYDRGVG